jgi:excisionase family DNA binding protein|tara:strand:+ start:404 stop:718 length:315 start_codon:yes stop_codon:yes gene_type:complete
MKIEFSFNEEELINKIAVEVVKATKPLLSANKSEDDNSLLTVESLAAYLNVKKQWVYEKVHCNEIPYYKVGKYPRFKKEKIEDWLKKREKGEKNMVRKVLEGVM